MASNISSDFAAKASALRDLNTPSSSAAWTTQLGATGPATNPVNPLPPAAGPAAVDATTSLGAGAAPGTVDVPGATRATTVAPSPLRGGSIPPLDPPPSAGAATAAGAPEAAAAAAPAAEVAAGGAARGGLLARGASAIGGGALRLAKGLAVPLAAVDAGRAGWDGLHTDTNTFQADQGDGRAEAPGPIAQGLGNAVAAVSSHLPFGKPVNAGDAAQMYSDIGTRTGGVLANLGNKLLGTIGLNGQQVADAGNGDFHEAGPLSAANGGTGTPANPAAAIAGGAGAGGGTPPGGNVPPDASNSGGSYIDAKGVTHVLSPADVAAKGQQLRTLPAGVSPFGDTGNLGAPGQGAASGIDPGLINKLIEGSLKNQNGGPGSNSFQINRNYDNLENELRGSFTSAAGKGNLARHLVEAEGQRSGALSSDAGRLTSQYEAGLTNDQTRLRGVADIASTQRAQQLQAAQQKLAIAQYQHGLTKEGAEDVDKQATQLFTNDGPDGKPVVDNAGLNGFRTYLGSLPPDKDGRSINDLPIADRNALLKTLAVDYRTQSNKNNAAGLGGKVSSQYNPAMSVGDANFNDVLHGGLGPLSYLRDKLGAFVPGLNTDVVRDTAGQARNVSDVARDLVTGKLNTDVLRNIRATTGQ